MKNYRLQGCLRRTQRACSDKVTFDIDGFTDVPVPSGAKYKGGPLINFSNFFRPPPPGPY